MTQRITLKERPDEQSRRTIRLDPAKTPLLIEEEVFDGWIRVTAPNDLTAWISNSQKGLVAVPELTDDEGNIPPLQGFGGVKPPRTVSHPLPRALRVAPNQRGKARIAVVIEKNGLIGKKILLATSGNPQFDIKSLEAVEAWRFEPLEKSGYRTSLLAIVEMTYQWYP